MTSTNKNVVKGNIYEYNCHLALLWFHQAIRAIDTFFDDNDRRYLKILVPHKVMVGLVECHRLGYFDYEIEPDFTIDFDDIKVSIGYENDKIIIYDLTWIKYGKKSDSYIEIKDPMMPIEYTINHSLILR